MLRLVPALLVLVGTVSGQVGATWNASSNAAEASAPAAAGASAPGIDRPELKPRYIVEMLEGKPFTADGVVGPKEWPATRKPQLECLNKIHNTPSELMAQARIGFDGQCLQFFISIDVDAEKPLQSEGPWGKCDGVELALSDCGEGAPVVLLHVFPDGRWDVTSPDPAGKQRCRALREAAACGVQVEKGQWTAELALPLKALGIAADKFRQLRFNMNVRRTCDDTWTCWWTPESGIEDLLSSGLLILPRTMPETAEMIRRREAARPLFDAEAKGELGWCQLKDWALTADPDRLGPTRQPADAPAVRFTDYAGYAVARLTFEVTAEQLASPFCAVFVPCLDEQGDVYINGQVAISHTTKATGMAPGLLWREPFLVDLKRSGVEAGEVSAAVHIQGNMGTGGLRKGVFLVWGKLSPTAEQAYDFFAEHPRLGWRDRPFAFWKDFERARIPQLPTVPDEANFGKRIQRTMDLLASSTAEQRNHVRILFYGQSIVAGMHCREMVNVLRSRYPWAVIDFENRAIGGFSAPSLVRTSPHDLYPRDADLVVFHVYGGEKDGTLEDVIAGMRQRNSSDILVYTHHYTWTADPERMASGLESRDESAAYWLELAEKYRLEVAPVRRDWPLFFREHDWGINEVMGDTVHSNVHHNSSGHTLLAKLVLRNFRHHRGNTAVFPDSVRQIALDSGSVSTKGSWRRDGGGLRTAEKGARLTLAFNGNRVDVLPLPCRNPGTARILIDGKPPAEFHELYYCSSPSVAPYDGRRPAIKRIDLAADILPRQETWCLRPFDVDLERKSFSFTLEGSLTGPDGSGSRSEDFVSDSGRIRFSKRDFMICWSCTYRKKDRLPEDYTVTWEVRPLFVDPWRPPANVDVALQRPVTLVKGLSSGPHTLEIVANGDGEIPIRSILVRRPPMD